MNTQSQKLTNIAASPWFVLGSGIASVASFLWFFYDKAKGVSNLTPILLLSMALATLCAGYVYSIRVRSENIALRDLSKVFLSINTIYRDELHKAFASESPRTNLEDLLAEEERVLKAVCQRIDTLSTNRLNEGYHLHMLSALANQMYNFISLMRGKYTVFVDQKKI